MKPSKLPNPATSSDEYAYATVTELRRLNDNLGKLVGIIDEVTKTPDVTGEIELKEPAVSQAAADADAPLTVETVDVVEPERKPSNRDAKKAAKAADTDAPVTVEPV